MGNINKKVRSVAPEEINIFKPMGKDYPIIERTNNALLWPEEIKDEIDINNKLRMY